MNDDGIVIVGGGLAGGLLALKLAEARPEVAVSLIEAGERLGGNHTWSFHDGDLTPMQGRFVSPLVAHRWHGQAVRFPDLKRQLRSGYQSVTSERFDAVLSEKLAGTIRLRSPIRDLQPNGVTLHDGTWMTAKAVIDARGFNPHPALAIRFQSFLGRELRFREPHGVSVPLIMDATTPQSGGYRFTYLLPFSPNTMLVEDTGYVDHGALDIADLDRRIDAYCLDRGWTIVEEIRRETGVLPIALDGDIDALWRNTSVPRIGLAGFFFHPTTGYSLPDAVQVADVIAGLPELTSGSILAALRNHAKATWKERRFFRALNRMLFLAGQQTNRWRVMQRFYTLPEQVIERFYAGHLTAADKLRILAGKPPVPVGEALRALLRTPQPMEAR